jgi:drug/metabolite transporter (DMT)-like permease
VVLFAVGLALVAAAMHGTWNVMVKTSADPLITIYRSTVMGAVIMTPPALIAYLVVRPSVNPAAMAFAAISGVLEVTYMWLLSSAYARGELSVVYPIARGSAPLLAVAIGLGLLGERLAGPQLIGVGLLLSGILAVTLPQWRGRATLPALLTGAAIASYTAVDRVGVRLTAPWFYGWMLILLMAIGMAVTIRIAARLGHSKPDAGSVTWRRGALIGAIMWSAYLLVLLALAVAPLSVIAPVRETAIVAVAVWGVWRLGERRAAVLKVAGAAATVLGVFLLAV